MRSKQVLIKVRNQLLQLRPITTAIPLVVEEVESWFV